MVAAHTTAPLGLCFAADSVSVGEDLDGRPEDVFARGAGGDRGEQEGGATRPKEAAVGAEGAAPAEAGGTGGSLAGRCVKDTT